MYGIIEYADVKEDYILIDVRSPGEYEEYTIPGAINIPLLDNEERKLVGTIYHQDSVEEAKKVGIRIVSKKLPELYDQIVKVKSANKNIVLFCERGGMRSTSLCELFNALGMGLKKLNGGYKAYRALVNKMLPNINSEKNYLVLHGYTGTGKTDILKELSNRGYDILDLEGIADHRGSTLGKVGLSKYVSQKQFESEIFESLRKTKSNNIFIEAESKRIGAVIIPDFIIQKMKTGRHILVEGSLEKRAIRITDEYVKNDNCKIQISEALDRLRKMLGNEVINKMVEDVTAGKFVEVASELMKKYYDPLYNHTQKSYHYDLAVNSDDIATACDEIELYFKGI